MDIDERNSVSGIYKVGETDNKKLLSGKSTNSNIKLEINEDQKFYIFELKIDNQNYVGKGYIDGKEFPLNLKNKIIPYKKSFQA